MDIFGVICIFLLGFFIGILAGISLTYIVYRTGTLVIDRSDYDRDKYSFEIERPLDTLPEQRYVMLKIKVLDGQDTQEKQRL